MIKKLKSIFTHSWKYLLFLCCLLVLNIFIFGKHYQNKHQSKEVEYGVSFSIKYAEELGLDWQETYLALLDELEFKKFRLMSYWDLYETQDNVFDFSTLDWQLDEAEKRGAKVSLAIGARQPRHPECHIPKWAEQLGDDAFDQQIVDYVGEVTARYVDHPAIESYQLENEAANRVFSVCRPYYDPERIEQEYLQAKANDNVHPVIINVSNQSGLPVFGPIGDKVGFSIYKRVNAKILGKNVTFTHRTPSIWHSFRANMIELFHNREVFAHEIQAEPWGSAPTKDLSQEEMAKTMNPQILQNITNYTKEAGFNEIYFWGGEWWYWQMTVQNNSAMWAEVDDIL